MKVYEDKYIIVISSNSQATYLYNELMKKKINIEFISTPSKIVSGCSKSIIFRSKNKEDILSEITSNKVKIYGVYRLIRTDNGYEYIRTDFSCI
ncbi:hypothetical protein CPAST_c16870 [Clostridium pasteurianum DSM 525 = ATCC 6013]|uniref:Putative Se/S carrier protein-like domain-containing protein n=1 Tax=Clostridium pasteurianum DSM 525 = ATCC 6013 TaxID=1262449 RepID=A0A0H3J4D9_CLOPA|nr:DUF3343 domain-containing protein [Clostridium pasteurianum]AJA47757.1 hypothetical protein CPAST_c16870 [Clostridium pasteurianum DSM 525 = ATCC 6013]AJA51745.1 hypothetical protein CLPA_c16870 [Clostridium pasteurianum DSM 525 = ATCC 6013]AOZ75055.1 hypothetical protein AQ983_08165 [Clostridium pasteurianum DSM 525 = ATCC 6013]AOZ78850.1 hypothetical protein AQ984_08155 [Clostridium pasteurianum]ELP59659.1 hypothetical protein F502_07338 [Clostridium pasteurianum DSM 525 = ATCC 6013]